MTPDKHDRLYEECMREFEKQDKPDQAGEIVTALFAGFIVAALVAGLVMIVFAALIR